MLKSTAATRHFCFLAGALATELTFESPIKLLELVVSVIELTKGRLRYIFSGLLSISSLIWRFFLVFVKFFTILCVNFNLFSHLLEYLYTGRRKDWKRVFYILIANHFDIYYMDWDRNNLSEYKFLCKYVKLNSIFHRSKRETCFKLQLKT